ncbi:hypothetical protein [Salinibius halmophilus]|uniref:hypothetical protein n=1 Tax=Salinibius halmophilus TaxID=1853216 RepID=UPI000E67152F|nr:hypothetical protein [Salinibius halmophilus]
MVTLDMIDAAVKVSLGILVSAICFYWYWNAQRKRGVHLDVASRRRLELLEQVSSEVAEVHHNYQQFLTLTLEFARHGRRWPASRRQELRRKSDELVAAFKYLSSAESTLLLLGEKNLERALRGYGAKIVQLRRLVSADKYEFAAEELALIEDLKKDIGKLRDAFYDTLSSRFGTSFRLA